MNKRKVYQPPEGQIFWIEANSHLLEAQSYPATIDAGTDTGSEPGGFGDLDLHEEEWGS